MRRRAKQKSMLEINCGLRQINARAPGEEMVRNIRRQAEEAPTMGSSDSTIGKSADQAIKSMAGSVCGLVCELASRFACPNLMADKTFGDKLFPSLSCFQWKLRDALIEIKVSLCISVLSAQLLTRAHRQHSR